MDTVIHWCGNCRQEFDDADNRKMIDLVGECLGCWNRSEAGVFLVRDDIKMEWVELGEGWHGDYDADDPEDEELLRFDVYVLSDEGLWENVEKGSYCTRMPAESSIEDRQKALELMMGIVQSERLDGNVLERLSWIGPEWLRDGFRFGPDLPGNSSEGM